MMIQQLSAQSADMVSVKSTGTKQEQNTEKFRSMLQTAAQRTTSKANEKGKGTDKTQNKTQKKDAPDDKMSQARTNAEPQVQSALQNAVLLPNAADSHASVIQTSAQLGSNPMQEMSVEALPMTSSEITKADGEQILPAERSQAGITVSAENGTQAVTGQTYSVSTQGQIFEERQTADDNEGTAYQAAGESNSGRADAELPINPLGKQAAQVEGENIQTRQNQNIVTVQQNAQTEIQEEIPPSSVRSDTVENSKTKSTFPKVAHAEGNDGTSAAESLSNLYNSGNVVIRVSDQMGQTRSSPIQQIADTAVYQMQNGKKEFTMELYPQSLGKVSVKLISHSGMLTVEIAASNPKTQSLILSGSAEIRNILQSATAQNVQAVIPNQQVAQWYDQPSDGGGGNSNSRRRKQENSRRHGLNGIASVSSELHTEDFLTMMQQISAYAR